MMASICSTSKRLQDLVTLETLSVTNRNCSSRCSPQQSAAFTSRSHRKDRKSVLARSPDGAGGLRNFSVQAAQKTSSLRLFSEKINHDRWKGRRLDQIGIQVFEAASRKHLTKGRAQSSILMVGRASVQASSAEGEKTESSGFVETKLAIFVSGGGSNFRAIQKSILEGKIYGKVVVVVSDKPECGGCQFARENNIPVLAFPKGRFAPDGVSPSELVKSLRELGVEYVVLAGYLKLLPAELVAAYSRAILNIHPALLPSFGGKGYYGIKVHTAVIRSGARFSGATVHFVDEEYDNGPIAAQRVVPVLPLDTPQNLQARVLKEEHHLYSYVLAALCEDRITWREDGVPLIRESWNGSEYV